MCLCVICDVLRDSVLLYDLCLSFFVGVCECALECGCWL